MTSALARTPPTSLIDTSAASSTRPDATSRRFGGIRATIDRMRVGDRVSLAAIFVIASIASTWNILGAPPFQDDEGTYTAQAMSVQHGDLAPYTYWYDHPPLGWIQLALFGWIPRILGLGGGTDLGDMRYVVAGYFVASAMLIYLVARRVGARIPFALVSTGVFVFSPLSLVLGRQIYLDTIATPWLLLAFFLALNPRRQLWQHAASGLAFATAVLSKLTMAVFGPALLLAMLDRVGWRNVRFSLVGFLTVGGLALALFPLMAMLRGELVAGPDHVSLQDALSYQLLSRSGSGWLWEEGSARAELIQGWIYYDGFIIVGGVIASAICLLTRRTRWIFVAVAVYAQPVVFGQGYLPAMYIVAGIPFLALATGVAAQLVWDTSAALTRRYLPGARIAPPVLLAMVYVIAFAFLPIRQGFEQLRTIFTVDENADWRTTLEWAAENIPTDEVVLVPYSMFQDLNSRGWNDPWTMIVLEKVDLDAQFTVEHPDGWREVEWIIEGPTVQRNLVNLGLTEATLAFDNSSVVESFGAWNIRRVESP